MILDNYQLFLDDLIEKIERLGIDIAKYQLDHLGYQTSSDEDYEKLKLEFKKIGKMFFEETIGGRRVAIYELNNPLPYQNNLILAVELVAPKQGQVCPSALEHAEFVIDTSFETLAQKYPKVNWDRSAVDQPMFPMLKIKLGEFIQVKFHYKPVLEIVGATLVSELRIRKKN